LIRWTEETLIQSGGFSLLGNKKPLKSGVAYEVILVNATETPIERPKRGKRAGISGRKSGIR
jgi:hypothetical protein